MKFETYSYMPERGWSVPHYSQLDSDNTLVLVFAAPELVDDVALFETVIRAYPKSKVIGCSTAGEILDSQIHDRSLSVAVLKFESTKLRRSITQVTGNEDSYEAGEALAKHLYQPDMSGLIVFADGSLVNGSAFTAGINSVLPPQVPIIGGLAGDGDRFGATWVLSNSVPIHGMVTAVGLYGSALQLRAVASGGWERFGHDRTVTRSVDNELFELDGRSALEVYHEYMTDDGTGKVMNAFRFPLGYEDAKAGFVVRTPIKVNDSAGSITFAGNVPEGSLAHLLYANPDRLIDSAADVGNRAKPEGGEAVLGLIVSCVGRRLALSERSEEEVELVLDALPKGSKLVGFYSYGEIAPSGNLGGSLHNETITIATFFEAA